MRGIFKWSSHKKSSLGPAEYLVMHMSNAINELNCYIVIFKRGSREPEHTILANLLSPHSNIVSCLFYTIKAQLTTVLLI